jgi:hypothetical protein
MPEWLVILSAAAPGLIAAGGLYVRVQRLERDAQQLRNDIEKRVSRELFDVHVQQLRADLAEVKGILLGRSRREDNTDPGLR